MAIEDHSPRWPLPEPTLPDAELEVMACLWKRGTATVREVQQAMQGYRPMTHASAFTLLKRLQAKGLVTRAKGPVGKAFVFKPTVRPGRTYRRVIGGMLERIFGDNPVALAASLFETRPPTSEELGELQELLDRLRENTPRR